LRAPGKHGAPAAVRQLQCCDSAEQTPPLAPAPSPAARLRLPLPTACIAPDAHCLPTAAAHDLPEVRHRALRSLQFKVQHGLLNAADPAAPAIVEHLLAFLSVAGSEPTDALVALELLAVLAQEPPLAAQLLQLGADQVLIQLADATPACTQPATALLGALLCQRGTQRVGGSMAPSGNCQELKQQELCSPTAQQCQVDSWGSRTLSPHWQPTALAAARSPAPGPSPADLLAATSLQVRAIQLSAEDSQQLFELALELQPQPEWAEDAALLASLATLRHGVLADMPAAALAGEPALLHGLLAVAGIRGHPQVAAAALQVLRTMGQGLVEASDAAEGEPGLPVAPLAFNALLRCAPLLSDTALQHEALATALALVPLLAPVKGTPDSDSRASCRAMAPLLAALTDALRLGLVSGVNSQACKWQLVAALCSVPAPAHARCHDPCFCALQVAGCTDAGVAPPEDWASGFHALALGPLTVGILRLVVQLAQCMPHLVTAQVRHASHTVAAGRLAPAASSVVLLCDSHSGS
jgi:hypothetical protein